MSETMTARFRVARVARYPDQRIQRWLLVPFVPDVGEEDEAVGDVLLEMATGDFAFTTTTSDRAAADEMGYDEGPEITVPWDAEVPPNAVLEVSLRFVFEPLGDGP